MRYIVEIKDENLEDGCAYCPMNYDYQGCLAAPNATSANDPMLGWQWDGCKNERPKDCPLIPLSCASCPEMDNPDSYISHLQSALKWHDEHVPRPTNPRNTCVVLQGQKPPEEVLFVLDEGGVTHYLPEGAETCHMEVKDNLAETDGMGDVWLECDRCHWQMPLDWTTLRFRYCPNCRARIKED